MIANLLLMPLMKDDSTAMTNTQQQSTAPYCFMSLKGRRIGGTAGASRKAEKQIVDVFELFKTGNEIVKAFVKGEYF